MALIPDGERLVSRYLREHAAIDALGARVVGKTPDSTSTSWVRVTQLDAGQGPSPSDRLVPFYFQFDCYAGAEGGQPEANTLGRTIRAALTEMSGTYADGTVSGAKINGDGRIPDGDFEPARERRVLTATVWAHA